MDLHAHESGAPDAPAIVFLHGSPLSGRMWLSQLQRLGEYHCLAPDLPGHGGSREVLPVTVRDTTHRIVDLIQTSVPQGRAHVVGLSFGGVIAQALMVAAPEVVDHVVLSGTSTRLSRFLISIQALNEPLLRWMRPERLAALIAWQFGVPREYLGLLREDLREFSAQAFGQVMEAYAEIEMPTRTASPTLVVVGQKETFFARRAARVLARSIPKAKGVLVPGAGHVWNLQEPDLFAETVRAWIGDRALPTVLRPLERLS